MKYALTILLLTAALAGAQSTIDPAKPHAWSPNTGWIDFRWSASHG